MYYSITKNSHGIIMRILLVLILSLSLIPTALSKTKNKILKIIAKEPVTMMDLGILKLNASLSRTKQRGLRGATIGAKYNAKKGTIDIKVSKPVKKASRAECKKLINNTKKIFIQYKGKEKYSTIYYYFQHEGTAYTKHINWKDLSKHVLITGIAITKKNYQDNVYCQSKLMKKKVTY